MILTENLRNELKIPLGKLILNSSLEKESSIRKIYSQKLVITVGDATSELLLQLGLIPLLHIVDGREKRKKRELPLSDSINTILTCKNKAGQISEENFNLIKTIFKKEPPIRLVVNGEEDLFVLPVCLFAPKNSVVMYGQPNEGLVIVEISEEIQAKIQKIVNQMK